MPTTSPVAELIISAKELVAAVSFDMNGIIIGNKYVGGNGGLLSNETLIKADAVQRALAKMESEVMK